MKILLAVDGSDCTKRMLAFLAAHDEWNSAGNAYTVLTVVPEISAYAEGYLPAGGMAQYAVDASEGVLKPIRAFVAQQGWTVAYRHALGDAARVIAATATEGRFDLVVLGSHGHSALGNVVMGSVATGVLARCKVPVLLIR